MFNYLLSPEFNLLNLGLFANRVSEW